MKKAFTQCNLTSLSSQVSSRRGWDCGLELEGETCAGWSLGLTMARGLSKENKKVTFTLKYIKGVALIFFHISTKLKITKDVYLHYQHSGTCLYKYIRWIFSKKERKNTLGPQASSMIFSKRQIYKTVCISDAQHFIKLFMPLKTCHFFTLQPQTSTDFR